MANNVETLTWNRVHYVVTGALISSNTTLSGNATPTLQQIIDVRKYVLFEGRRGLTDEIIVYGPKITHCNYKARVWLFPNMPTDFVMSGIETAVTALLAKQNWLGYDHSRMAFDAALAQTGVHHAIIDEPVKDVNVDDRGFVKVDMVKIVIAGTAE
jgi:phage-related baseplate assembly protein